MRPNIGLKGEKRLVEHVYPNVEASTAQRRQERAVEKCASAEGAPCAIV